MKKSLLYLGLSPVILFAGETVFVKQMINIYETPSLTSKVVGTYKKRAPIEILERIDNSDGVWQKTQEGYVLGKYLSFRQSGITKADPKLVYKEYIPPKDMLVKEDTNVRNEPNLKNSTVVAIYKKDENVKVKRKVYTPSNGTWYNTKLGYVSTELLKEIKQSEQIQETIIVEDIKIASSKAEEKFLAKDVFVDKNGIVYTKIPAVLADILKKKNKEKEAKLPPKPDVIYGNFSYAKVFLQEEKKNDTTPAKPSWLDDVKYYGQISLGYDLYDMKNTTLSGAIPFTEPNDNGMGYKLTFGAYLFKNYALGLNYSQSDLDEVKIKSYTLSLDYIFEHEFNPYMGISLGKIYQEWQIDPLVDSTIKDNDISSNLYGIQTGINYLLKNNWYLNGELSYQKFNLKTNLISTPAKSLLEYKDKKALEVGVRYSF